ncbi:unnamed protein product [Allacma fusca]|uniref:Uncharacterized protein n=1 Tax=Allacma fusca TaxID=39272 RepID=A0A8J2JZC8_9HEXA|nr:unnamed protein product [Allacma fusca]
MMEISMSGFPTLQPDTLEINRSLKSACYPCFNIMTWRISTSLNFFPADSAQLSPRKFANSYIYLYQVRQTSQFHDKPTNLIKY